MPPIRHISRARSRGWSNAGHRHSSMAQRRQALLPHDRHNASPHLCSPCDQSPSRTLITTHRGWRGDNCSKGAPSLMFQNGSGTISEHIVTRLVAALDAAAILAAGLAAMHLEAANVDWRLAGLVVLLGTILGVNFLHLVGAYRFRSYARLDGAIGRVLLGWLATFAALFVATRLFEPA